MTNIDKTNEMNKSNTTPTVEDKTIAAVTTTPAPDTIFTPTSTAATTATAQSIKNTLTAASLPADYLTGGTMLDGDGVILPEYLGEHAESLAKSLAPLSAFSFQRAFLTKAKEASKKKVPYSAKKNCALGMVIAAKKLVARAKDPAPAVLLEMITAATATVTDEATFAALYMHLDAIYTAML